MIRGRQGIVSGIGDEYGEQLGRFSIARVATDQMMCSRRLIPALARAVDVFGLTLYLARDLTRTDLRVDERPSPNDVVRLGLDFFLSRKRFH